MEEVDRSIWEPLYIQITKSIKEYIKKNNHITNQPIPSENELSKKFNVSRPTVRKAIAELVHQGFIVTKPGKGSFISNNNKPIPFLNCGVFVYNSLMLKQENYFTWEIYNGILSYKGNKNVNWILIDCKEDIVLFNSLYADKLNGLICVSPHTSSVEFIKKIKSANIPVVTTNFYSKELNASSLQTDNYASVCELMEYIINHMEMKKIAFIGFSTSYQDVNQRFNAYKDSLLKNNININKDYTIFPAGDKNKISNWVNNVCKSKKKPEVLLVSSSNTVKQILIEFKSKKIRVPDDIAIVGFDDPDFFHVTSPTITTIRQPLFEIGQKAAETLLKTINQKKKKIEHIVLKNEVIFRGSLPDDEMLSKNREAI